VFVAVTSVTGPLEAAGSIPFVVLLLSVLRMASRFLAHFRSPVGRDRQEINALLQLMSDRTEAICSTFWVLIGIGHNVVLFLRDGSK
jgi:hypothetical protein